MSAAKQILWIDNDPHYLEPFREALMESGFEVTMAETVSEAAKLLSQTNYNLVILDVMLPTSEQDEAEGYTSEPTGYGYKTGLAFYLKHRDLLLRLGARVMVLTVRIDRAIADEFVSAGVPRECMVTKYEMVEPETFLQKVNSILAAK